MRSTCRAVLRRAQGSTLREWSQLRLRGSACARLSTTPCQIAQNASRSLNRGHGLWIGTQTAVNPLGHKQQRIVVQRLSAALTDGRHKGAL